MEQLTDELINIVKFAFMSGYDAGQNNDAIFEDGLDADIWMMIEENAPKLAALVQAESEGRVDIHPCTEGTAVYVIREVRNHYLEPYHYEIQVMAYKKYMLKNYGKTVFLEKGAAEAALAAKEEG